MKSRVSKNRGSGGNSAEHESVCEEEGEEEEGVELLHS